jgi:hypothetical protein
MAREVYDRVLDTIDRALGDENCDMHMLFVHDCPRCQRTLEKELIRAWEAQQER